MQNKFVIVRNLKYNGNYNTELYSLLNNINNVNIYNEEHGLRHPLGIYNISFGKILRNCRLVIDEIKNNTYDKSTYINFLESINEFVDDGYNIMKCFYPKNLTNKRIIFSDKWLECVDKIGITNYKSIINQYINDVRYTVNKLKHEHGRINDIKIETIYGSCRGYFLEKYNKGSLEPDEYIHKKYGGKCTGFSYLTDIMKNMSIVYFMSEQISKYLRKNIDISKLSNNIVDDVHNSYIKMIIDDIWILSDVLFPNEYNKDLFSIKIISDNLEIKYPAPKYLFKKFPYYTGFKGYMNASGDGTSASYTIPYL